MFCPAVPSRWGGAGVFFVPHGSSCQPIRETSPPSESKRKPLRRTFFRKVPASPHSLKRRDPEALDEIAKHWLLGMGWGWRVLKGLVGGERGWSVNLRLRFGTLGSAYSGRGRGGKLGKFSSIATHSEKRGQAARTDSKSACSAKRRACPRCPSPFL